MNRKKYIITLDGPAAAGKGTISKILSKDLNLYYLETGLYYRILARNYYYEDIDEKKIKSYVINLKKDKFQFNLKDKKNIFNDKISNIASILAKNKIVRNFILNEQRTCLNSYSKKYSGILLEGRDCGTVIVPSADVKIFVTADVEVRARRRFQQYLEDKKKISYEKILIDLKKRDYRDKKRNISPLIKAKEAFLIDSTRKSMDEMINIVKKIIFSKIPSLKN